MNACRPKSRLVGTRMQPYLTTVVSPRIRSQSRWHMSTTCRDLYLYVFAHRVGSQNASWSQLWMPCSSNFLFYGIPLRPGSMQRIPFRASL